MRLLVVLTLAALVSFAFPQEARAQWQTEDEQLPGDDYDYSGLEGIQFADAPDEPVIAEGTVDPSIPRTTVSQGNGRARVRFDAPVRVVVRPRVLGRNLPPRRARLPAGSEFEGPDSNNNGMPDDLERPDVAVLPD